jgi:hypothetical protein
LYIIIIIITHIAIVAIVDDNDENACLHLESISEIHHAINLESLDVFKKITSLDGAREEFVMASKCTEIYRLDI